MIFPKMITADTEQKCNGECACEWDEMFHDDGSG